MRKKKILQVGEASYLNTGFSTYSHELLSRLHSTGKYEVAELGCYGGLDDVRRLEIPWTYYHNEPPHHLRDAVEYNGNSLHQFGAFSFNDVLLTFQPDIVIDIRDHWMLAFEGASPFRKYFHWVIMPTVDAIPQNDEWISTYIQADAVLTYSDWGGKVLGKEGGGLIKWRGSAPPAADPAIFRPMDRIQIRRQFGFEDNILIVGTIMRNQSRKLYPQLIEDFSKFLQEAPGHIANRTYLYLHTSYPDRNGWDIPYLIKQSGISNKILVTYRCQSCRAVFPLFFQDVRTYCPQCKGGAAMMPNSSNGVDQGSLAKVINLFDIYVQYANSEGFGIPMVEAASCGVPVAAVDYSAMSDVVRKVRGMPIPVESLSVECSTNCLRAKPDSSKFITLLINYLSRGVESRKWNEAEGIKGVSTYYQWDQTVDRWMGVIDSLPLRDVKSTWKSPPNMHKMMFPNQKFPSNEQFVHWCIDNVVGRSELKHSYLCMKMIRDLGWGVTQEGDVITPFDTNIALEEFRRIGEANITWEMKRSSLLLNHS